MTSSIGPLDVNVSRRGDMPKARSRLSDWALKGAHYDLLLPVIAAILLWALSVPAIDPDRMTDLGFISVMPFSLYLAFALLIVSFGVAVWRSNTPAPILGLCVVALVFMIHGTPQLVYGTLRYEWAWKHVGIVDYIQRHGGLDRNIANLDVYHNWPGFFALNALLTQLMGFDSAVSYAGWAPVIFNLLSAGGLWLIFSTLTTDRRVRWLGIGIFLLTNWVGQDYFSPQALGYFLYLIIVGICLRWFNTHEPPDAVASTPMQRAGLMTMVILLFVVIATSHQLTPIMVIVAVAALILFRRVSARRLPVLLSAFLVSWLLFGAAPFLSRDLPLWASSFGQVVDNFDSNLVNVSQLSADQRLVATLGRGLTGLILILAGLGIVRRRRRGYDDSPAIILMIAPAAMLAGNSYGGEVLFRTYLFAVPLAAFFAATVFFPGPTEGTSRRTLAWLIGLSLLLFTGFGFAYYGKDQQYYFSAKEVEAAEYVYNTAPAHSLLVEGTHNYPAQFRNYENFTYVPLEREPKDSQLKVLADPDGVLQRWLSDRKYAAAYLIITRSQKAQVAALGVMPPGSLDKIEQALLSSPQFRVVYRNADATIFALWSR